MAGLTAGTVALGALVTLDAPARAEGFLDSIRSAFFGRIVEVKPASYAALPREPGRYGRGREERGFADPNRGAPLVQDRSDAPHALSEWRTSNRGERRMTRFREVRMGSPSASGRNMCVRLCDGYAFPLARMASGTDTDGYQNACNAACPGAQTALYRLGSGSSLGSPARATAVSDGSPYKLLATAFLYRKERVAACSCQGADNIATRLPIDQDPTLRRGDVVVAANGTASVYDGSESGQKTFTDFRDSAAVTRSGRQQIDKVMGVSQREATARAFAERMKVAAIDESGPAVAITGTTGRTREAALRVVTAPAGSGSGVRAFTVVTPNAPAGGSRSGSPAIYVIR